MYQPPLIANYWEKWSFRCMWHCTAALFCFTPPCPWGNHNINGKPLDSSSNCRNTPSEYIWKKRPKGSKLAKAKHIKHLLLLEVNSRKRADPKSAIGRQQKCHAKMSDEQFWKRFGQTIVQENGVPSLLNILTEVQPSMDNTRDTDIELSATASVWKFGLVWTNNQNRG